MPCNVGCYVLRDPWRTAKRFHTIAQGREAHPGYPTTQGREPRSGSTRYSPFDIGSEGRFRHSTVVMSRVCAIAPRSNDREMAPIRSRDIGTLGRRPVQHRHTLVIRCLCRTASRFRPSLWMATQGALRDPGLWTRTASRFPCRPGPGVIPMITKPVFSRFPRQL